MKLNELPYDVYVEEGEKIGQLYLQATEWLTSIGIPYSKTRFGKYKKVLDHFDADIDKGDEEAFKARLHEFLNAHAEVTEIVRIYNELSEYTFTDYIDQLKKVTSGRTFRNISAKDQSRDFAFELTMAARFMRGGFTVNLNHLADVVAKREDTPKIYVECKRIKSLSKIKANIKKANQQLKTRLNQDRSNLPRGLVAINVNDLINPNNNMMVIENIDKLQKINSHNLNQFVQDNVESFNAARFSKNLGVFCEHVDQAFIFDRTPVAVANCRGVTLYQYHNNGNEIELINKLANSLSNQTIF
jgi:hypothetical protein